MAFVAPLVTKHLITERVVITPDIGTDNFAAPAIAMYNIGKKFMVLAGVFIIPVRDKKLSQ